MIFLTSYLTSLQTLFSYPITFANNLCYLYIEKSCLQGLKRQNNLVHRTFLLDFEGKSALGTRFFAFQTLQTIFLNISHAPPPLQKNNGPSLIAYEINAQGWKKRLGLVGFRGRCILKIAIAMWGGYNFRMSPWDAINDGSLKPFTNWFIGEYFTPLSSSVRANEVLRTPHFASDFSCFQGADQETDFVDFLLIEAAFSKKKLHQV